jgi:hypothetical protein
MRARRFVTSVGVAAGLIGLVAITAAVAQSSTTAASAPRSSESTVASASGGSAAALVYPSVVAVHLDRSEAAIARAEAAVDSAANAARAGKEMATASAQAFQAWKATRYVIKTAPPPPPPGDRAGVSGDAAGGPSFASPPDTSLAVFSLQHDLVTAAAGLMSGNATLNTGLIATMNQTTARRDAAIEYIHKVAPPAPPPGDRAGASGAAVTPGFAATMPSVLPLLDDEMQALRGAMSIGGLPASAKTAVRKVVAADKKAETKINTYWPPVVGDG